MSPAWARCWGDLGSIIVSLEIEQPLNSLSPTQSPITRPSNTTSGSHSLFSSPFSGGSDGSIRSDSRQSKELIPGPVSACWVLPCSQPQWGQHNVGHQASEWALAHNRCSSPEHKKQRLRAAQIWPGRHFLWFWNQELSGPNSWRLSNKLVPIKFYCNIVLFPQ